MPKIPSSISTPCSGSTLSMEPDKDEALNFGRSLIVPSVQELSKQSITEIPPRYVHHQLLDSVSSSLEDPSVPVIDLQYLFGEASASYSSELNKLHTACKEWGFFQVINHGISESLLEDLKREVFDFFKLPIEEKQKLWQKEDNHEGFGQLFVVSEEQKLDWSDMFYITTLPHNIRKSELFQNLPLILRHIVSNGVYKSIEHRAILNTSEERMSIATFYSSNMGTELGPARSLVTKHNVENFRRVPLEAYFKNFFARKLDGKSYLDFMKFE